MKWFNLSLFDSNILSDEAELLLPFDLLIGVILTQHSIDPGSLNDLTISKH